MDPNVVTSIIKKLESIFVKDTPLTIQRVKKLIYLGMELNIRGKVKVDIDMINNIEAMLKDISENMDRWENTPAATYMFNINKNAEKLTEKEAQFFHTTTAKILFTCKRSRSNVQTAVSFLCRCMKEPNSDNYKKLRRIIRYLRKTKNLVMRLQITDITMIKWWVGASFAAHPNMRGHTGEFMMIELSSLEHLTNKNSIQEAQLKLD